MSYPYDDADLLRDCGNLDDGTEVVVTLANGTQLVSRVTEEQTIEELRRAGKRVLTRRETFDEDWDRREGVLVGVHRTVEFVVAPTVATGFAITRARGVSRAPRRRSVRRVGSRRATARAPGRQADDGPLPLDSALVPLGAMA